MYEKNDSARKGSGFSALKPENIVWSKILWLVAVSVLGGWVVYASPWFVESQERHFFDVIQKYGSYGEPKFPMIRIAAGSRSLQAMKEWVLPRDFYARLVRQLKAARLVLMDVPFDDPATPEEDRDLIEAVREHGRVLGRASPDPAESGGILKMPFPALHDAFRRVGVVARQADPDGISRMGVWGYRSAGREFVPSLVLAALEELEEPVPDPVERFGRSEVRLSGRTLRLYRSGDDLLTFWMAHPQYGIPTYEYVDVLDGTLQSSDFADAVVIVSAGRTSLSENVSVAGGKSISQSEYLLHTLAALAGSLTPSRLSPTSSAVLTAFMVLFCASMGFIHFRKSLLFLLLFFFLWIAAAAGLLLGAGIWLPAIGPLQACLAGYLGSQIMLSWRLYHEWNVRSLSIRPLLALAQRADSDFLSEMNFDDYLRSLWKDIEEKTGVTLHSTRLSENFSLVQEYLIRAQKHPQQGQDSFLLLKNASDTSPHHRMLLPLPMWKDPATRGVSPREYVILAWDGQVPMETLTSLAALTLFAAVHFHGLEEGRRRKDMLYKTIEAIMMAVEAKDPTTSQHSRRVAALSKRLAQWMKLSPREVDDIYFAASIHDIGKLGIPDSILNKPGVLTPKELAEMHRHPVLGEDIMRPVELTDYVMSGILQHHESYDGSGYPYGLQGKYLTMAGKIIKVADVFDALMNRRQYKEPWTEAKVREFLLERRGTEFDPLVVDVFLRHISDVNNNPLLYYGITF